MNTAKPNRKSAKSGKKLPPDVLYLNLQREFFAAIAAGTKKTEYRDVTPFWDRKLAGRRYTRIYFRNGYKTDAPEMWVEFKGLRIIDWNGTPQYAIALGRVIEIKRWRR